MCCVEFFFGCCFAATQLARQLHQEHTKVVCNNKEAWKRLARRHSRNGPWTHECCVEADVFVCWEWIEELEWLLLLRICFSSSFFLGLRRPNLITGLNSWCKLYCFVGSIVCLLISLFIFYFFNSPLFLFLFLFLLEFINGVCGLRWICCGGDVAWWYAPCRNVLKKWCASDYYMKIGKQREEVSEENQGYYW